MLFPSTVRKVKNNAFTGNWSLRSAVLKEGVEKLHGYNYEDEFDEYCIGAFAKSGLRQVALPATLKVLGRGIFCECRRLKRVTFAEGSQLREIGIECFKSTGLEEIVLPPSVRKIGASAFISCE